LQKSVFDQALLFLDERLAESDKQASPILDERLVMSESDKQNTRIIITLKKTTEGQKKLTVKHKKSVVNDCLRS
jgi:hypothetical protein